MLLQHDNMLVQHVSMLVQHVNMLVQRVSMLVQHVNMLVQHAHDPFHLKGVHLTKDVTSKRPFPYRVRPDTFVVHNKSDTHCLFLIT
jgi:hypothetical protein